MFVVPEGRIAYFDVDDTLLEWVESDIQNGTCITHNDRVFWRNAIQENIDELIRQAEAGTRIVVWSAGGSGWAETVVNALQLADYVDCILTKPDHVYDDKDPKTWMPKRRFGSSRKL